MKTYGMMDPTTGAIKISMNNKKDMERFIKRWNDNHLTNYIMVCLTDIRKRGKQIMTQKEVENITEAFREKAIAIEHEIISNAHLNILYMDNHDAIMDISRITVNAKTLIIREMDMFPIPINDKHRIIDIINQGRKIALHILDEHYK